MTTAEQIAADNQASADCVTPTPTTLMRLSRGLWQFLRPALRLVGLLSSASAVNARLHGDDEEATVHPMTQEVEEEDELESPLGSHPSSRRFLELLQEMAQLHKSKSADYGSEEDPLANIRHGADYVDIEPWRGCFVRIADKVQRLRTYCRTGRLVHEGVRDTLLDLAAYSLLAIVLFEEGRNAQRK